MKIQESLPIGSIVKVKGIGRKLMIFGYKQISQNNPEKVMDYIGVVYPEGYINRDLQIPFNSENIEEVVFPGFEDDDRLTFLNALNELEEQLSKMENK